MGVMTNVGGGGGGNIRYNAVTDMIEVKRNGSWVATPYKAYADFDGMLYNAGVQAVPWDNTGYLSEASDTDGGHAVLSADSFTFYTPAIGGNKAIITNDKINLNGFTTLRCTCGGTTYNFNISSYTSEQAYIIINCYSNSSHWYLYQTLSRTKEYYNTNQIAANTLVYGARGSAIPSFTKVWLE